MRMTNGYPEIDGMDWFDAYRTLSCEARLPYSVHIPLNWPAAKGLTFCDCAMNAYFLPSPALDFNREADNAVKELLRIPMICFGFGAVPFVPDFRRVQLSRRVGGLPLIRAEFSSFGLLYAADYCLAPDEVLHIRMTVKSELSASTEECIVWVHPQMPLEREFHPWHYVPYRWTAKCWRPEPAYRLAGEKLCSANGVAGAVFPGRFGMQWIAHQELDEEKKQAFLARKNPDNAFPDQLPAAIDNTIRMNLVLQPGEEASFELAIRLDGLPVTEEQLSLPYDAAEKSAVAAWKKYTEGLPEIDLGEETENHVIEAIRLCNLQLLLAEGETLRPCQGGLSERYYVWVWEAMCALRPMIRLGHFSFVRKVIEFIFRLQDGGCPPVGDFTTVKGAVGTSGPKWANATGSALLLASEYIRYAQDQEFARAYLPRMMRAACWITGELHATRKLQTNTRGILPNCRSTDGDTGQTVFTDAWTLSGLSAFGELLMELHHPDAAGITAEARQYKADLDAVMDAHTRSDGFIPRSFGDQSKISFGFRFTCTPLECCTAHVSSATEPRMSRFLGWMERNAFQGVLCSPVSHDTFYVGNNELCMMKMYMVLNRTKSAWAAGRAFRRFVVTPDVYLTQERYSTTDCTFTAWQPNASNNGRFLDMQLSRFFYESVDGTVILFGAFAPFELKHNPSLRGLHSSFGRTDLVCSHGTVSLTTEKPLPAGQKLLVCGREITLASATTSFSCSCDR